MPQTPEGDIHREFETILRSAHAEYERAKISLSQDRPATLDDDKKRAGRQPGHPGHYRTPPKATKVVEVSPRQECPRCGQSRLRTSSKLAEKTIVDLVFTASGCRRTVTKYVGASSLLPAMCAVLHSTSHQRTTPVCLRPRIASLGHLPASGAALALPRNHSSARRAIPCAPEPKQYRYLLSDTSPETMPRPMNVAANNFYAAPSFTPTRPRSISRE